MSDQPTLRALGQRRVSLPRKRKALEVYFEAHPDREAEIRAYLADLAERGVRIRIEDIHADIAEAYNDFPVGSSALLKYLRDEWGWSPLGR